MTTDPERDVKTALLDAAEHLLADFGVNGVSLRRILTEAGANSAALHYHFKSRAGLVEAILVRHGEKINLRRRQWLAAMEQQAQSPDVDQVVDALVDPMVEFLRDEGESGRRFLRFLARLQSDRCQVHHALQERHFPDVRQPHGALLDPGVSASADARTQATHHDDDRRDVAVAGQC